MAFVQLKISFPQFPLFLFMREVKAHRDGLISIVILLIYDYMDYWLPILLFISFPLWIIPALLYYTASKSIKLWKCFFRIGSKIIHNNHIPQPSYAILKGNGRYLRDQSENVHKKQFYDYTSRRFMSIGEFQPESKIIELECVSSIGLEFFAESMGSGIVVGVQSSQEILKTINNSLGLIVPTDYSVSGDSVGYDCLLLFNFKSKVKTSGGKVDLIKILMYCRHHMSKEGYIVFGDYFEKGELATFIEIFSAFRLKVAQQEDITKNIEHARKLANKKKLSFEQKINEIITTRLHSLFGVKNGDVGKQFIVLILEKMEE